MGWLQRFCRSYSEHEMGDRRKDSVYRTAEITQTIRREGPEVDDFDETVCHFPQDGNGIIQHYKDFKITDEPYHLLVKFDVFCHGPALKYYLPQEFIDTPEGEEIIKMAKDVLKASNYQI